MSNIESTKGLLQIEIDPIKETPNPIANGMEYRAIVHTPKLDIHIKLLSTFNVIRDYNMYTGDYIYTEFSVPDVRYFRDIHPYVDNLEITITSYTKDESEVYSKKSTNRYKLVISNQQSTDTNFLDMSSNEDLSTSGFRNLACQCIEREYEAIRTITVNGIYRDTTVKDLMICELGGIDMYNTSVEGSVLKPLLSLEEPDNNKKYEHIIVGAVNGTGSRVNILDLPSYLQNQEYGVYNGNIGTYYQKYNGKGTIFVSPLYDSKKYDDSVTKLHIIKAPDMRFDTIENTFMVDGDVVKILARSNAKSLNTGENDFISQGVGYTYTEPSKVIERSVVINDNSFESSTDSHTKTMNLKDRRDTVNKSNYVGTVNNLYLVRSEYIKASMAIIQLQWSWCDMDLIYPYMPVCYMYVNGKSGIVKLYGTVQSTVQRFNGEDKSMHGIINIAVEKMVVNDAPEGDDHNTDILDF